jgi:gentisate 1,2-dioxygenase
MTAIESAFTNRARCISVEQGFNIKRPELAPCRFDAERELAFDSQADSGVILLDKRDVLQTPFPATSPLLLAKFLRIRAGTQLGTMLNASGEIYYVMQGTGRTTQRGQVLNWAHGDIFCLPGGKASVHESVGNDCVLFCVTDEPMLAFERVRPADAGNGPIEPVHYPADRIASELEQLARRELPPETPGRALFLTSERMAAERTCLPSLTLTLNLVLPGESQRPHRHSAAAVVLITEGGTCRSAIGDRSYPWDRHSVFLTPPNAEHSHVNDGDEPAVALIVQDGGLHYHCRTMGFQFA